MFKHILLPTDGSDLSEKAVKQAIPFAKEAGAKITAFHVIPHHYMTVENEGYAVPEIRALKKRIAEEEAAQAQKILGEVKDAAEKAGVECDAVTVTGDEPYEMIIEEANKAKCDLIVMASHGGKGLEGLLRGSETVRVLTHSTIPVLVCR